MNGEKKRETLKEIMKNREIEERVNERIFVTTKVKGKEENNQDQREKSQNL